MLTIRAHRREETESEDRHVHRTEVRYGSLERSVRVPPGTSVDDVTASYVDGVLTVSMPLPVPPAARRIPVDHPEPPGRAPARSPGPATHAGAGPDDVR